MSNTILAQLTQRTQSRGLTFALLKEIGFRHHPKFGYAFPKLQTLANVLRVSVRTVQRHIHKLEALGELRVIRAHGRGLNNRYILTALENVTGWRPSNHTQERKASNARIMPGAADPSFSLSGGQTTEHLLARWLTRGSRLWRTITGET
jgi:DeoR/GlpR family transcriptional regulator of sugar metabolism